MNKQRFWIRWASWNNLSGSQCLVLWFKQNPSSMWNEVEMRAIPLGAGRVGWTYHLQTLVRQAPGSGGRPRLHPGPDFVKSPTHTYILRVGVLSHSHSSFLRWTQKGWCMMWYRPELFPQGAQCFKKNVQFMLFQSSSIQFSCWVMSNSLWPHGLQHARPPCPSPTPRACSNSWKSSWWCHPTISSSVIPFTCLQSFPASGSFPMSQFFASDGQSIGVSASASVFPMNI